MPDGKKTFARKIEIVPMSDWELLQGLGLVVKADQSLPQPPSRKEIGNPNQGAKPEPKTSDL